MSPAMRLQRRADDVDSIGTVPIIIISISAACLFMIFIAVLVALIIRKRRNARNRPTLTLRPALQHKNNDSESSTNPLLTYANQGGWDFREKYSKQEWSRPMEDERTYDIITTKSAGYSHVPSGYTLSPTAVFTPTVSSNHSPYVLDIKPLRHSQHPNPRATVPSHPPLPPLIIPTATPHPQGVNTTAVVEDISPTQPLSSSASSVSLYSQSTAEPSHYTPSVSFLSLPAPGASEDPVDGGLKRGETRVVANLLKARAKRNPDGLVRLPSQVSHIERVGSIKSVGSFYDEDRPFPHRYRSRKSKSRTMDVVTEGDSVDGNSASSSGGHRSRSESLVYSDISSFLTKMPPDVHLPRPPPPPVHLEPLRGPFSIQRAPTLPLRVEPKRQVTMTVS